MVEVGGGLRDYTVDGRPVLDGYAEDEMASAGRGQVLLPWPNRVDGGTWRWEDKDQQLALTEVNKRNASHGLVRWAGWQLERVSEAEGIARHVLHPQTGYPFRLASELRYRLTDDGLLVEATVENRTDVPVPLGLGFHPYLAANGLVDDCRLTVPAGTRIEVDDRGIPVARHPVERTDYDYRTARVIGEQVLDTPFTDVDRVDGEVRVVLGGRDGRTTLWMDETFGYVQVFTGDTLPQDRRRRGVAIEPMTAPANALA
ncbi:MAG: aldose 1-epimerase, partial [Frankiaceae bacterium]|nr:aldose 1-epimerase [Frankiaceae bacterium]